MNQEYESERLLGTFSFFCMHHGVSAAEGTVPVASSVVARFTLDTVWADVWRSV